MLKVYSQPQNQPILTPGVISAPQVPMAPKVAPVAQPLPFNPQVQTKPQVQPAIVSTGTAAVQQPYTPKLSLQEFAQTIKANYPEYGETDDSTLAQAMLAKYPEYSDRVYIPQAGSAPLKDSKSVTGFLGNTIKSGGNFIKDTTLGLANIVNPNLEKNTVANLARLGVSAVDLVRPGEQGTEHVARNVGQFFKDRYGGAEQIKNTLYKDPVGALADAATILSGGAGAVSKVGTVSKVGKLANTTNKLSTGNKVANVAGKVSKMGKAIDPLNVITKGLGKVASGAGRVVGESAGLTTGAGYGAIKEAFRNPSPEFIQALRGKIPVENIVTDAREALQTIREQRSAEYLNSYQKVWQKTGKVEQNLAPIAKQLEKQLDNFNVRVIKNLEDGKLNFDFSRSTISDGIEANRVKEVVEAVYDWGSQQGDSTVIGLDILKRKLDDFYSPSRQANAFIQPIKQSVRNILERVPEYKNMTREYAQMSDVINEVERGLSLGTRAATDTTLKKLTSVLRDNNEFRKVMVEQLQKYSDSDLKGQIAGAALGQVAPRGLMRTVVGGGLLGASSLMLSPAFLASLPLASPRVIGELVRALGLTNKQSQELIRMFNQTRLGRNSSIVRQGAYQVERTKNKN